MMSLEQPAEHVRRFWRKLITKEKLAVKKPASLSYEDAAVCLSLA